MYGTDEKQVFKNYFSPKYYTVPAERMFDTDPLKNLPESRGIFGQCPKMTKETGFLKYLVSLVVDTKIAVFKTPPPKSSKELKILIQCTEMIKYRFSKIIFSAKNTTVRAERIFGTPTVKNLSEGREIFAHSRTTTEKTLKVRKNSLSNRLLWRRTMQF